MALRKIKYFVLLALASFLSCKHPPGVSPVTDGNYPKDVATIIINKCATTGCHDNTGYINADGLNLSTWDDLFKGSSTGSTVIPYRPDFSSFCYFINTDNTLGISLLPTMPYNGTPLSKDEYTTLRDWIASGAADVNGKIKFADDPLREKIYVTNRNCDVVTVFDAASLLQMRYINVGDGSGARYPYCIKVSPDKEYWYVSFFTQTNIVQKFDAANDKFIGTLDLGTGAWTSFAITTDSKYGYFVDNSTNAKIVYVDLDKMTVLATYTFGGNFSHLTGIALNDKLKKLYVGTVSANLIYDIDISDPLAPVIHELPLDIAPAQSVFDWVEMITDTNTGKCYVASTRSNEIKVLNMQNDALLGTITLTAPPAFMAFSHLANLLFITCPDDSISFPGNRGALIAVDPATNSINKIIKTGYQPYGLTVDDSRRFVAVANANISSGGPPSHHASGCGKKNGNVTFIDLNTLTLIPGKKPEVAVFPFGVAAR